MPSTLRWRLLAGAQARRVVIKLLSPQYRTRPTEIAAARSLTSQHLAK